MADHVQGTQVILEAYGQDPAQAVAEHMVLKPQARPDPSKLGDDDVLVEVQAAAVGWVDLLMSSGQYQHMVQPPYTPGLEYAGVVQWIGSGVSTVQVGDRIMADGLLTGPRSLGQHQKYGGFARWAVGPSRAMRLLPAHWSFDQGCNFFGNYETAWHCLIARGQLQGGETVLIHGASGSTGLAAVQVAKLVGARVIVTGRNREKLDQLRALGADEAIQLQADGEGRYHFRDAVKALTGGKGVHVVYDGVGGMVSAESLRCMRFGGRFLVVGWASTPDVARGRGKRGAPRANLLPTNLMMMKGLDILGCPTAISTHRDPALRRARLGQLLKWVESGALNPHAGPAYAMADFKTALMAKWESRHLGGCILRPCE